MPAFLIHLLTLHFIFSLAVIRYERPNPELYSFQGALIINGNEEDAIPLNLEQTLWRVPIS